jgi:hypothetical protein
VGGKVEEWMREVERVLREGVGTGNSEREGGLERVEERWEVLQECLESFFKISNQFVNSLSSSQHHNLNISNIPTYPILKPLYNHSKVFLDRLHHLVKVEGKIIRSEIVKSWFLKLENLREEAGKFGIGGEVEGLVRGLEEGLIREVGGWVGKRWLGQSMDSGSTERTEWRGGMRMGTGLGIGESGGEANQRWTGMRTEIDVEDEEL